MTGPVTAIYVGDDGSTSLERGAERTQLPPAPDALSVMDSQTNTWQPSPQLAWADARAKRAQLLSDSDWTQLPDAPLTAAQKSAWVGYRQLLRDLTAQPDPFNLTWPQAPAA